MFAPCKIQRPAIAMPCPRRMPLEKPLPLPSLSPKTEAHFLAGCRPNGLDGRGIQPNLRDPQAKQEERHP